MKNLYDAGLYAGLLEESMLFLLALKWNLQEKALFCVKTKTNSNFAVKLTEGSNRSILLWIWWITFFKNLYWLIYDNGMYRT